VAETGGLPIEPVVDFAFGATNAAVEGFEVEEVAVEGRGFVVVVVVGLAREVVGFFGLAGGLLD